jgi:hypothetical protein
VSSSAPEQEPYLSVVVPARNSSDAELLRLRLGLSAWLEQAARHGVPEEIVIVEWNPPKDRPRLAQCLMAGNAACRLRVIEVLPEVHAFFSHHELLPMFEHLAANVGIRRASGRFVLSARSGVVVSEELIARIARRDLEPGSLYRCDTWEVTPPERDLPPKALFDHCDASVVRIHRRRETLNLETGRINKVYQRPLAIWWEPVLTLAREFVSWLDAMPSLLRALGQRAMACWRIDRKKHSREFWLFARKLAGSLAMPFRQAARLYATRRSTRTYFLPAHINGCANFLLLDRQTWLRVRGFPEMQQSSYHIDSLFALALVASCAVTERELQFPARSLRLGALEEEPAADARFAWLKYFDMARIADGYRGQGKAFTFNPDDEWGLGSLMLTEKEPIPAH